ncbi:MAG: hypothetical protein ABJD53_07400 [Gammaproteobacteria bacterium]
MTGPATLADVVGTIIAAAGALGTACFGIVEALKWTPLGEAGFSQIPELLGPDLLGALHVAYGPDYEKLLRAQYRQDSQGQSLIAKALRQGVRLGLTADNAAGIAAFLGTVNPQTLHDAAQNVAKGVALASADQNAIGRFEMAVDARIDSALSRARDVYLGAVRCTAGVLAIIIAESVLAISGPSEEVSPIGALLVGLVAVPLAPIANDVVAALQAATKALRGR